MNMSVRHRRPTLWPSFYAVWEHARRRIHYNSVFETPSRLDDPIEMRETDKERERENNVPASL